MECAVCFGKEARLQRCGGGVLCACSLQICDECLEKWIDKKKRCALCARILQTEELDRYVKIAAESEMSSLSRIWRCLLPCWY